MVLPADTGFLIVGLGNPGDEYASTRHNAGFHAVDHLAGEIGVRYWGTRYGALEAEGEYEGHPLVLAKPQSFMNASGGPVKQIAAAYGIKPDHIIVVHDEMDLDPGSVRVKRGGGHAGHNGLKSIIEKLGSPDFLRVRIGIGKPTGRRDGADYVLAQFRGERLEEFDADCARGAAAALSIVTDGVSTAMNLFNRKD